MPSEQTMEQRWGTLLGWLRVKQTVLRSASQTVRPRVLPSAPMMAKLSATPKEHRLGWPWEQL
jgi:hypothetical protein